MEVKQSTRKPQKKLAKTEKIQFHRRSRYEDILDLVNDNEDALKPFPNRDAVFYKQSNKGSYFDGRDHLEKLRVEQNRISEREIRDRMARQYASDDGRTHRALFTEHDTRRTEPQISNMETDDAATEVFGNGDDFVDPQEDTSYTNAQLTDLIQRAEEARRNSTQAITEAHAQQMEVDQHGGDGILHNLGRGLARVGQNIAAGVAAGQDLRAAAIAGVAEPVISGVGDMVMRRILPQQRPLLDIDRAVQNANSSPQQAPNTPPSTTLSLPPSIILQPHQPNIGATQQPLPPAAQQPALPAFTPAPRPTPNFQQGGSSSSSGNANAPPPPQQEQEETRPAPKRRMTKKTNLKESARADASETREEQNLRPAIIPSKIGIQKLREVFEDANNKKTITGATYGKFRSSYNAWIGAKGDPAMKKSHLKDLQKLYRETVYGKQ